MAFFFFFLDFFLRGPFLKSSLNLLQYCFCFMFWFFGLEAGGILAPQPGIEPTPPTLEGKVLNIGTPGKSLQMAFNHRGIKDLRYFSPAEIFTLLKPESTRALEPDLSWVLLRMPDSGHRFAPLAAPWDARKYQHKSWEGRRG